MLIYLIELFIYMNFTTKKIICASYYKRNYLNTKFADGVCALQRLLHHPWITALNTVAFF